MKRTGVAAIGAAVVLLAGVGGVLVAQERLNGSWLRRAVIASVERQSGRTMTLDRLTLRLLPAPRVEADGLALSDRAGVADSDMVRIGHLSAAIGVWPLLRHVVLLDALQLDNVTLHVVRDADGHGNWEMKPEATTGGGTASGHGAHWGVAFGSIRVNGAEITLRDVKDHHGADLHLSRLAAAGLQGEQPHFSLLGVSHGAGYSLQGTTGSLRRLFDAMDRRTAWPVSLQGAELIQGTAVAHGEITGSLADPAHGRGYDLAIHLALAQFADLNRLFVHAALPELQGLDAAVHVVDDGHPAITALQAKAGPTRVDRARDLTLQSWSAAAPSRNAPLAVAAAGNWRGQALTVTGQVASLPALNGMLSAGRSANHATPMRAAVPAPVPVQLSIGLGQSAWRIEGSAGAGASDLRIQGSVPDLRTFSAEAPDLGPATLQARLLADRGIRFRLSELRLASGAGDLSGHLMLTLEGRPVLSGALRSNHIDVNRIASVSNPPAPARKEGQAQTSATPASATPAPATIAPGAAGPARPLPWLALGAGDADLSLQAGDLLIGRLHYRDFMTHVVLKDGHLIMDPLAASGPAGPIAARMEADAVAAPPVLTLSMHPLMLPASSLTALFGWPHAADGAVELVGQVRASGATRTALAGSLNGHAGLSMTDGSVANSVLSRLTGPTPVSAALSASGVTALRCLAVHAALSGGEARIDTLSLRTGRVSMDGNGRLGLADGGLDLRLVPDVRIGSAWASLPMRVTGSLADPHPALDAAASGGRYTLTIGPSGGPSGGRFGGGEEPGCAAALQAAREGLPGPAPSITPPPEPGGKRKAPKPADILRSLGILH